MKLVKSLSAISIIIASSTYADGQSHNTDSEKVQYFAGYQEQFNRGGQRWGIVDDLDWNELLNDNGDLLENGDLLRRDLKARYTENNEILFDVQWTNKTLKLMYPEQWQNTVKGAADKASRKAAIKAIRAGACDAQMEVGYARTYGINGEGYAAELDTNNCENGRKLGTVRMRTFIPTTPGAEYAVHVKYQKRDYNYEALGAPSEKHAYRDLMVRVPSQKHKLSIDAVPGEVLDEGFKQARLSFIAKNYYSTIVLKDTGYPDSFGILIRGIEVEEIASNTASETCDTYYPEFSGKHKKCLTGEIDPETVGCDLSLAALNWKQGDNIQAGNSNRTTESNILLDSRNQFLSLGKKGKFTLTFKDENGKNAACPVAGKTLNLSEITYGNGNTFETYAEQGTLSANMKCLNADADGFISKTEKLELKTKDALSYTFEGEEYASCRMTKIVIKDKTHKIKKKHSGYVANSDGIDLNGLSFGFE